ncbi:cation transporter [Rhodocista pekingensis]|uniref:Cation transporter n=1 Tax=Rhodocista pekingensis TaxID=201185 RepID=A0ABW2L0N4_9PROT
MGASCCAGPCSSEKPPADPAYRRVLWAALLVNAAMFGVEIAAGAAAGSVSLKADAMDFLSDAANYAISLFVLGAALAVRARATLVKGLSLGAVGLVVAGNTLHNALLLTVPGAEVMGAVGLLALAANVGVAALLYAWRDGDSNRRSVWICSRNDAIGNVAVVLAAAGVFGTGTGWPDIVVAAVMAGLAVSGAVQITRQALAELRGGGHPADASPRRPAEQTAVPSPRVPV